MIYRDAAAVADDYGQANTEKDARSCRFKSRDVFTVDIVELYWTLDTSRNDSAGSSTVGLTSLLVKCYAKAGSRN